MSFLTKKKLNELAETCHVVEPYKDNNLEEANFLLSIGNEIFVSSQDVAATIRQLIERETFSIDPGQFAFILTEEKVSIPLDKIGFISIRASIKFKGLVNISGFHVDPGYSGKLIFAVYNAGPTRIYLRRGDRVFPM